MIIKSIIFKGGLLPTDDLLMKDKGWRGGIVVESDNGDFYELTFITLERLSFELKYNSFYYENFGYIITKELSQNIIIKTIIELNNKQYFTTQKKINSFTENDTYTTINITPKYVLPEVTETPRR